MAPNDALEVTFGYLFNNGGSFTVQLWDTEPSKTRIEQIRGGWYLGRDWYSYSRRLYTYYAESKAELNESLALISISPRQALDTTSPTATQKVTLRGFDIQPEISFYFAAAPYSALEWLVSYSPYKDGHRYPTTLPSTFPDSFQEDRRPFFRVEAASGTFEDLTKEDLTEPDDSSLPRLTPKP